MCLAGASLIFREVHNSASLEQTDTGIVKAIENLTYIYMGLRSASV
jgi:hypothetical protein